MTTATASARSRRLTGRITLAIQGWLAVGLVFFVVRRDWENVDALGALIVGSMGYAYARHGRFSFLIDAVRGFMHRNPRLFGRTVRRRHMGPAR